jgi:hypothetical protein
LLVIEATARHNREKEIMNIKLTLSKANAGILQDAWHYAMMVVNRGESTFDGDREYPEGIRGQMIAYEKLLGSLDKMCDSHETWQLVKSEWFKPSTFADVERNAVAAVMAIGEAAKRLGVEARTGEKITIDDAESEYETPEQMGWVDSQGRP